MIDFELTYRLFGSSAILIEWPQQIDLEINRDVHAFDVVINSTELHEFEESVPAYASLTLFFAHLDNPNEMISSLKKLYSLRHKSVLPKKKWIIPVCYDSKFAIDLEVIANALKLKKEEIIEMHTGSSYPVFFI